MKNRTTLLLGVSGLLLFVGVLLVAFLWYQLTKSFPRSDGTLRLEGLGARVEIARDEYGVPAITASTERDLLIAQGFVHAQDRLWQMDLERRAAQGRLSELFGSATVPFDRMFRIVGLTRIADQVYDRLSDSSKIRLQWYTDGVNACIATYRGRYPVEFDMLGYSPEPWLPVHSVLLSRLVAWELNLSWWTDITLGSVADRVGLEKTMDLMPVYPGTVAPQVPAEVWRRYAPMTEGYLRTSQSFAAAFAPASFLGGSNAWVVSPSRSATGTVLLANDTHLHLSLPCFWYEVGLLLPHQSARGMSIPGYPYIVSGRNRQIAWGITNVMADEADFFVERVDPGDSNRVQFEGAWERMTIVDETIRVRGDSAVTVRVRRTRHGPVVTDIATPLTRATAPYVATMRWAGEEVDDQCEAFRRITMAENWEQFIAGVRRVGVPGQNFVYGDIHGHIGYHCGAKIPIRGMRGGLLPVPGWDRSSEWSGFVPPARLPHMLDPPEGFVASANNKLTDDTYPYRITDLWEPPSRIVRLRSLLGRAGEKFSVQDFGRMQNDSYSVFAEEVNPYLLLAFGDTSGAPVDVRRAYEYASNWHFRLTKEDIATTIFHQFLTRLMANTFRDEMGDSLYHDFVVLYTVPLRILTRMLHEGTSPWFDDIRTDTLETRDDQLRRSLREALDTLRILRGADQSAWRWGDLHTVTLSHPFSLQKPLQILFSKGPYPAPGASTALVSGEFSWNDPFRVIVGASYRQIFDLRGDSWSVLAGGQSGQVFHKHFDDQIPLWANGGYRVFREHGSAAERTHSSLELIP